MSSQGNSWRSRVKPACGGHAHDALPLGRLDLLFEEDVDAVWGNIGVIRYLLRRQQDRRAQQAARQVGQALDLRQKRGLAGLGQEPAAAGAERQYQ